MQVAEITYRIFKNKDLPGLLSLWEKFSGWGPISRQQFYDWYINTPLGPCLIIIATDETNEVMGQLVFIPAEVTLNGKVVKALRLSAPILHQDIRQAELKSNTHPALMMIMKGIGLAKEMGYHILYCLPAHGWVGLMKLLPRFGMDDIQVASNDCAAISLKDEDVWSECAGNNFYIRRIDDFTDSYSQLFMEAIGMFPINCSIIRNAERLQWKLGHHIVIEVSNENKLIGYAAYKKDGLLVDMFAATPNDLKNVLLASLKGLHYKNEHRLLVPFEEVKCMLNPQLKSLLNEISHQPVNFQFAFASYPLQTDIDKSSIRPENWYIMPDD